jgi:hypothetical protein
MFLSKDGHWRVKPIKRDGQDLLRVEHDSPAGMPFHQVDGNRTAFTLRTGAGWFLAQDAKSIEEVAKWVPLEDLEESTG